MLTLTKNSFPALFPLDDFFGDWPGHVSHLRPFETWIKSGESYVQEIDLPGFSKKDVEVTVLQNVLSVTAKKEDGHRRGSVRRQVILPSSLDPESVSASLEDGVLRILANPKKGTESRRVEIA